MRTSILALALLLAVPWPGDALSARPLRLPFPPLYSLSPAEPPGPVQSAPTGGLSAIALTPDPTPHPNDVNWQAMTLPFFFPSYGVTSTADLGGDLVLGGAFSLAGSTRAFGVTRWDGAAFHAMGTALTPLPSGGYPVALQSWGGTLYAATASHQVMRWNGTDWDLVATAGGGSVTCLAVLGSELVVGGSFKSIGGVADTNVAAFDGTTWRALPGAPGFSTLHGLGPYLYGGRNVNLPDVTGAIYRWDGSTWSIVGAGLNNAVTVLADDGTNLYAGGSFTKSGPDSMPGIARWTGTQWQRVGVGVPNNVSAMAWWNGSLYITGLYGVARFDGANWQPVGSPFTRNPSKLGVAAGRLIASGVDLRTTPGDFFTVATYDGTGWTGVRENWTPLMNGLDAQTECATVWNDRLVVGGLFFNAASGSQVIPARYEAQWDGTAWSAFSATIGAGHIPHALTTWGSELVAVGEIGEGNIPGNSGLAGAAHWDGTSWQYFMPNLDYTCDAAIEHLGSLYVATDFITDDASPPDSVWCIGRWTGTRWESVGGGLRAAASDPTALASWNGNLVVGGNDIGLAGNTPVSNIALWDGSQWSALGAGLDGGCHALASWNGVLVAGGAFTHAGGLDAPGAAYWDGTGWHAMGSEAQTIYGFTQIDGVLYAVGNFLREDASVSSTVARWTGTSWQILGSGGPPDYLSWVQGYHGDLFTGSTSYAFGKVSHGLIRLPAANAVSVESGPAVTAVALAASPNPARGRTTFSFALPQTGRVRLTVVDAAGRLVATLVDGDVAAGWHEAQWSARAAPGVYFARLEAPGGARRSARVVRFE